MTHDDALKIFGLTAKPDPHTLQQLYRALQKAAALRGDQNAVQRLNIARDILAGKMQADKLDADQPPMPMFSGIAHVTCATHKSDYVMDWRFEHGRISEEDILRFSNPRLATWDQRLGRAFDMFVSKLRPARAQGAINKTEDLFGHLGQMPFEFPKTPCTLCGSPHYDWCEHCGTIFCRPAYDSTLEEQIYSCPTCDRKFGWGRRFTGNPRENVVDGRGFRAVHQVKRQVIANMSQKLIGRS